MHQLSREEELALFEYGRYPQPPPRTEPSIGFDVYNDPGHGWAKVPKQLLKDLDLAENISVCSYQKGAWAYLEEDRDLLLFMGALRQRKGLMCRFRDHHTNKQSKIQSYEHYKPEGLTCVKCGVRQVDRSVLAPESPNLCPQCYKGIEDQEYQELGGVL